MALDRLFGNSVLPACKYCTEGFYKPGEDKVLCIKRGITLPDYHCKKFEYDPLKRISERPRSPQAPETQDLEIE